MTNVSNVSDVQLIVLKMQIDSKLIQLLVPMQMKQTTFYASERAAFLWVKRNPIFKKMRIRSGPITILCFATIRCNKLSAISMSTSATKWSNNILSNIVLSLPLCERVSKLQTFWIFIIFRVRMPKKRYSMLVHKNKCHCHCFFTHIRTSFK